MTDHAPAGANPGPYQEVYDFYFDIDDLRFGPFATEEEAEDVFERRWHEDLRVSYPHRQLADAEK